MKTPRQTAVEAMVAAFPTREEAMAALVAAYPNRDLPQDPDAFAKVVIAAARTSPTGVAGGHAEWMPRKVLLSHVVAQLVRGGYAADLAGIRVLLIASHKLSLLELSRCDLTQAFPTADVAASEITYMNATFHMVRC